MYLNVPFPCALTLTCQCCRPGSIRIRVDLSDLDPKNNLICIGIRINIFDLDLNLDPTLSFYRKLSSEDEESKKNCRKIFVLFKFKCLCLKFSFFKLWKIQIFV